MSVKIRKVGNSYTVTIPAGIVNDLRLYDGQELEVNANGQTLEYIIPNSRPTVISWDDYATQSSIRDGLSPDDYVRSLRDDDRQ